jgi:MFS family permease
MTNRERQGWIIVSAIFVTMFFIWGAINCGAVFFVPVLKHFGWTRARLSVAFSIGWITSGAAGPLIGWLADRINPKRMMAAGSAWPPAALADRVDSPAVRFNIETINMWAAMTHMQTPLFHR